MNRLELSHFNNFHTVQLKISNLFYLSFHTSHSQLVMQIRENFGCACCLRCYARKFRFNSNLKNILNVHGKTGSGGRMHPNEFYNYSLKQFVSSKKEATMLT